MQKQCRAAAAWRSTILSIHKGPAGGSCPPLARLFSMPHCQSRPPFPRLARKQRMQSKGASPRVPFLLSSCTGYFCRSSARVDCARTSSSARAFEFALPKNHLGIGALNVPLRGTARESARSMRTSSDARHAPQLTFSSMSSMLTSSFAKLSTFRSSFSLSLSLPQ